METFETKKLLLYLKVFPQKALRKMPTNWVLIHLEQEAERFAAVSQKQPSSSISCEPTTAILQLMVTPWFHRTPSNKSSIQRVAYYTTNHISRQSEVLPCSTELEVRSLSSLIGTSSTIYKKFHLAILKSNQISLHDTSIAASGTSEAQYFVPLRTDPIRLRFPY